MQDWAAGATLDSGMFQPPGLRADHMTATLGRFYWLGLETSGLFPNKKRLAWLGAQRFSFTQSPLFPRNPHVPVLRSGPPAVSGASRKKQFPSSMPPSLRTSACFGAECDPYPVNGFWSSGHSIALLVQLLVAGELHFRGKESRKLDRI